MKNCYFKIFIYGMMCCCPFFAMSQELHLVYDNFLNPRLYPDDQRRYVKPPDWNLFDNRTHFTVIRGFQMKDSTLINFADDFKKNVDSEGLGDVIWPNSRFLTANNIHDLVAEIKKRKLFLYQIWGYVPGSGAGVWHQFKLSKKLSELFKDQLGDHWLGMDMGEQDGRYLMAYANQLLPSSGNRLQQYLHFHEHIEKISNEMDNRLAAITAVNYGHYLLKEGTYTLIGAEAAQEHPNGQVFYSFNRGAGKQYGVPWFGNASVYNRFGWKTYDRQGVKFGPTKGTSLMLMKRLIYQHILYNSMVAGFEGGWYNSDHTLSPIGKIQAEAQKWVLDNGNPGVMQTPVALLLDFYAGWIFPSYNALTYRVWGNLPYQAADYLTNNLFGMIYPGYQQSSFFHNEKGFSTATPYGDVADALLSDAPSFVLCRYPLLIVADKLQGGEEIRDKLRKYVEDGGKLIITSGSLVNLPGGIAGIQAENKPVLLSPQSDLQTGDKHLSEQFGFTILPLSFPQGTIIKTRTGKYPLILEKSYGKGTLVVLASAFGIPEQSIVPGIIKREIDKDLPNPYPILEHVKNYIGKALSATKLFDVGTNLGLITCRIKRGGYTLGVSNNDLNAQTFKIVSNIGSILSVKELKLDTSEKGKPGYLPEGFEHTNTGRDTPDSIAGGNIRVFRVTVNEKNVKELKDMETYRKPEKFQLNLFNVKSIKEEILARPTFFQHYDGVTVDWKYLHDHTIEALRADSSWIMLQKLNVTVDLSSGINLFPDLRLVNNSSEEYNKSMEVIYDVLRKMLIFKSSNLIISLHKSVENNMTEEEQDSDFRKSLGLICDKAQQFNIQVNLRLEIGKQPDNLSMAVIMLKKINKKNLKLAVNSSSLITADGSVNTGIDQFKNDVGVWLLSTPGFDLLGKMWNQNGPIANAKYKKQLGSIITKAPSAICITDVPYQSKDEEYLDAHAYEGLKGE